jgi:hypothetical protein
MLGFVGSLYRVAKPTEMVPPDPRMQLLDEQLLKPTVYVSVAPAVYEGAEIVTVDT